MDVTYSIYLEIDYMPWHVLDWLEQTMSAKYLADFNWRWDYSTGDQRIQLDFFDEGLAAMTALKWI